MSKKHISLQGSISSEDNSQNNNKVLAKKSHAESRSKSRSTFLRGFLVFISLFFTGISLQFLSTGILNIIDMCDPELLASYRSMVNSSFSLDNGFVRVSTVMFISPVCEEIVFRGVCLYILQKLFQKILPSTSSRSSSITAVVISALLFGFYHGNIVQFCYAFPIGILLALLVIWTSSLIPSIFLHIVINVSSYIVGLLKFTGASIPYVIAAGCLCLICIYALYRLTVQIPSHKVS